MKSFSIKSDKIKDHIYIPKYYNPLFRERINSAETYEFISLGECITKCYISVSSGDEIGKMAYGTGSIPFVRTSDICNWEIKAIPKQGVSKEIFELYKKKQDVKAGDIILVKDGTYLIGTNCLIASADLPMIYQSHILKLRVNSNPHFDSTVLFLALNSSFVQEQFKSIQFTADIIDTIGNRYEELELPIPINKQTRRRLSDQISTNLQARIAAKNAIKAFPVVLEQFLKDADSSNFVNHFNVDISDEYNLDIQNTTTDEFGEGFCRDISSSNILNKIYLPKYYDPSIDKELGELSTNCNLVSVGTMVADGILELKTGDEIGKMAYGTGTIPFIRTSDFSNWEIKTDPKQGVSEEIYSEYSQKQDVQVKDILLVRDGTYLVGSSCMITPEDSKMLYCGGLIKIRSLNFEAVDPYLLFGLLNSYIVKRQLRTKQFTRDVIDTLGRRFEEVILPIPKDPLLQKVISSQVKSVINSRADHLKKINDTVQHYFVSN